MWSCSIPCIFVHLSLYIKPFPCFIYFNNLLQSLNIPHCSGKWQRVKDGLSFVEIDRYIDPKYIFDSDS